MIKVHVDVAIFFFSRQRVVAERHCKMPKDPKIQLKSPGIYLNIPAHHYHADPCPEPSLSSGIAKKAALQTPRHVFHSHARLNEDWDETCDDDIKRKTAQGSSCHELFLGVGGGVEVIDLQYEEKNKETGEVTLKQVENYNRKIAQDARDKAIRNKMVPRLKCEFEDDKAIIEEAKHQLSWLDMSGDREAVIITEKDGFWCRSMSDILNADDLTIIDLKFTKIIADEDAFGKHAYGMGYDVQDAHYCRNLARMRGVDPLKINFLFVCVECAPGKPVMTSVHQLEPALRTIGKERHERGEKVWQQCLKSGEWPGYPEQVSIAKVPSWALSDHIRILENENV